MNKNEELIKARKSKGLTQEDLSVVLGCTKATISNWENGYSNPSLSDAFKVAEVLEKDINVLFRSLGTRNLYNDVSDSNKEVI